MNYPGGTRHPGDPLGGGYSLPGRMPRYEKRAQPRQPREAEAAAKEGGERYRRAHLRRLGAIVAAVWIMASLHLLREAVGILITIDRILREAG